MIGPAAASRQADYPLAGTASDGANDGVHPPKNQWGLPWYDATKDADTVPKYTREYLYGLSTSIDTRLKSLDNTVSDYPESLTKTRKLHKCLLGLLIVLGLLWLATAVIIVIAVFKGSMNHK